MKTTTRSTSPASRNAAFSPPPPSTSAATTSRSASQPRRCRRSTRPGLPEHSTTVAPAAASCRSRPAGAPGPTAITARAGVPAWIKRACVGKRASPSTTTRYGSRGHGAPSRTVSSGSSARAVPMPTTIASARLRSRWVSARAASPVIQREPPCTSAILPSSVIAVFRVTCGRRCVIHVKKARFWARASSASSPESTAIPARRRISSPRPSTRGLGSPVATTTRARPAATRAGAHGDVRP